MNADGGVSLFHNIHALKGNKYLDSGIILYKGRNETLCLGVFCVVLGLLTLTVKVFPSVLKLVLNPRVCCYMFSQVRGFLLNSTFYCKIFCALLCYDNSRYPSALLLFPQLDFVDKCIKQCC